MVFLCVTNRGDTMRARDILKDFRDTSGFVSDDEPMRPGIVSDVFGTLIKGGELNLRYYKFLLWAQEKGIPVTIASSEPHRARRALESHGCADSLVGTVEDKIRTYGSTQALEAVIDDDMVLIPALITINPNDEKFRRFLATSQYRYEAGGTTRQVEPVRGPAP